MHPVQPDSQQTQDLLRQIRAGDRQAVAQLFARHRPYLHRLVELRVRNVTNSCLTSNGLIICVVSCYGDFLPQLLGPAGAAEKAVLRHHGRGDQTSTRNGETAHDCLDWYVSTGGRSATIVFGMLRLLSHTPSLETSATGRAALPRLPW